MYLIIYQYPGTYLLQLDLSFPYLFLPQLPTFGGIFINPLYVQQWILSLFLDNSWRFYFSVEFPMQATGS